MHPVFKLITDGATYFVAAPNAEAAKQIFAQNYATITVTDVAPCKPVQPEAEPTKPPAKRREAPVNW